MFRYEIVTGQVREWIAAGVLKPGDRLLSVREMSAKLGFSTVTVHQAYGALQDEGVLEARPRSGFYISHFTRQLPEFASGPLEDLVTEEPHAADLEAYLPAFRRQTNTDGFGSLHVSEDLLPDDELYRLMSASLRWEIARREQLHWQGLDALREVIVKRYGAAGASGRARDVVITSGLEASIGICLDLLARPGSKVLVETPMDAASVSAALGRNITCVEIYSHPRFGVDPEQFQYLIDNNDIAACILAPSNHTPTGVSYSIDVAKRIVEAATRKRVPIIENVAGQDLLHGPAPYELSQFDTRNLVIRVGGFSETLGPRFGAGWIALSNKHRWKVTPPGQPVAGEWARQKALAGFIGGRAYDRHLRKLRESVSARTRKGLSLIFQHFPENCTVSRPTGGYVCWVRGPKDFNAVAKAQAAAERGITFAPGPLFSVSRAFGNFVALNLSLPWTGEREEQLIELGRLLK